MQVRQYIICNTGENVTRCVQSDDEGGEEEGAEEGVEQEDEEGLQRIAASKVCFDSSPLFLIILYNIMVYHIILHYDYNPQSQSNSTSTIQYIRTWWRVCWPLKSTLQLCTLTCAPKCFISAHLNSPCKAI